MVFQVERSLDFREFLVDAGTVDSDLREDRPRLINPAPGHEPSRALGRGKQEPEKQRRRNNLDPQHPSPFRSTQAHLGDQVVRQERDQNAQHDVELLSRHETAANPRRRDLGYVQWRDDRRTADRQSTHQTEGEKRIPVPCQGTAERPDKIEDRQDLERPLSSPDIGGLACEDRPDDRADQGDGNGESKEILIQAIGGLECLGRARDDRCVKAKEKAAEGRHDRAADQGRSERDLDRRGCRVIHGRSIFLEDHRRASEGTLEGDFKASGKVGVPPGWEQTKAATSFAWRFISSRGRPARCPTTRAAVKASPAPMLSLTAMGRPGWSDQTPSASNKPPRAPRVRATSSSPKRSASSAIDSRTPGERPNIAISSGNS